MTGAQHEDCPNYAGVNLAKTMSSSGPRVAVPSVGADHSPGQGGDLGGTGQPVAKLPVQLLPIARVPGVGVTGSTGGGHQGAVLAEGADTVIKLPD